MAEIRKVINDTTGEILWILDTEPVPDGYSAIDISVEVTGRHYPNLLIIFILICLSAIIIYNIKRR